MASLRCLRMSEESEQRGLWQCQADLLQGFGNAFDKHGTGRVGDISPFWWLLFCLWDLFATLLDGSMLASNRSDFSEVPFWRPVPLHWPRRQGGRQLSPNGCSVKLVPQENDVGILQVRKRGIWITYKDRRIGPNWGTPCFFFSFLLSFRSPNNLCLGFVWYTRLCKGSLF